ncbi:MAG: DUF4405 domain-containing protein [Planctomycetes bacterium]|nr:DUF4405 domain-containing protein [Planctomycetota bacterium]MBL7044191.1 DUF4405 domain-containing protein [Pirellulaceae bacterium]
MRRTTLNFIVDLAAWVVILLLAATGLVVRYVLPAGSGGRGGGSELLLWGLGRHDWGAVHFWLSVALGGLVVLHIVLHWSWVCTTTRRHLPSFAQWTPSTSQTLQNLYGIGLLCAATLLTFAFVWFSQASVVAQPGQGGGRGYGRHSMATRPWQNAGVTEAIQANSVHPADCHIRGSMTLDEVADIAAVSVDQLKHVLGIAEDVPASERIGRQARARGLSMADVRQMLLTNRN